MGKKIVLFLGAGFSKPFGFPVMLDFFTHADNSDLITVAEKDFLTGLRTETRGASSQLRTEDRNLEDVLSFALVSPTKPGKKKPIKRLQSILQRIYSRFDQVRLPSLHDPFRNLF